jgi:hypothetical protein
MQALFGLRTDLNLGVGNRYSFSASIFYLGFIVGSYPAVVMAQRWPYVNSHYKVPVGIDLRNATWVALHKTC